MFRFIVLCSFLCVFTDSNNYFKFDNSHVICKKDEFKCKVNEECIPAAKFCDSRPDCIDESDEYDDCVHDLNCSDRFRCHDQHCIFKEWVCDGSKDCPDGSDEWNCSENKTSSVNHCKIKDSQYLCTNQRCISLNAVCDKKDDCGDGSDEGGNCTLSDCSSAKCNHKCWQTPKESVCTCNSGYELQNDNHTCRDIDECQTYGICDQQCVNTLGSYMCKCLEKYYLYMKNDKQICKAIAGEAMLTFSTKTAIIGIYVDSKVNFSLASNLNRAVGVVINDDYMYWSDIEEDSETIVRYLFDHYNKSHEVIVTTGLSVISAIAVDWVTKNIYFTDEDYNRIGVCNHNGTECTILISGLDKPTGIALFPTNGKMYWSDAGSNPRIAVAGMDGRNIRTFVSEDLKWPRSVTIDYPTDRLYWVDSKSNIIESIRLDGTDRRYMLHEMMHEPYSLAIFEDVLYWSDWGSNTIQSCNKFSGKDWRILYRTQNKPYDIHIDHSAIKPEIENPCKSNPCSQLCLLNWNEGYTCACTLDKELNFDKHTCQEIKGKQYLMIVTKNAFIHYYYGMLGKPKITEFSNLSLIQSITSDPLTGQIIIHSETQHITNIIRYDPASNVFENITTINNIYFGEIAFDYIGNNLYMPHMMNKSIVILNMKTMATTIFYLQANPFLVTLAPEEGKMFVALITESWIENNIFIYEMRLDGLGKKKLLKEDLKGSKISMYYDRDSKTLFMSDIDSGYIWSYTNTKGIRVLRSGLKEPTSLAVIGSNIFWIECDSKVLYWTDLHISSNNKSVAYRIPKKQNLRTEYPLVLTLRKDIKLDHDCQKNNGYCSHVCLVSSLTSFICACPPGMELSKDNRTCILHHECSTNEYKCSEHDLCIKKEKMCDGIIHCPNGEDESVENCNKHCNKDQFKCKNGECIKLTDRCNSRYDCSDESDEENCGIRYKTCASDEFKCYDGSCILKIKICDGNYDCDDFSDEFNCQSRTCSLNEFKCNFPKCIPKTFVCDGEDDCLDGEDETFEVCKMNLMHCQPGYFQCTNHKCISSSLLCNDVDDCNDGSDEKHCLNIQSEKVNCTANEYHCIYTDTCLPKQVRCNGKNDCPYHDDEFNCTFCLESEFACDNMKCIPETWVCDHQDDCDDNSDEKNCNGNKMTINESSECDEFKCSVGTCLSYDKVCDGTRDCPDGSDENGKCQIACTVNNFCKSICHKTPTGAVCGCQNGYRLATDLVSCEDINECEQNVCSQICRNTIGSYECACYDGYIIRNDKVSCKAIGLAMEFITATENDIRLISPNLYFIDIIHSLSESSISGLDVNSIKDVVYWSNDDFGIIRKINIMTKEISTITIVEHPQALAVDWITDNVYVIDNNRPNSIKVCNLEKQRCATLVRIQNKAKATSLVVDPIKKYLFWTQLTWKVDQPFTEVYRADMMGADQMIIRSYEGFVTSMTIDHIKSKLYLSDTFNKVIESCNFDGSQLNIVVHTYIYQPLSISIYEQSLYWLTGLNGQLQICKLYGKNSCETLDIGTNNIHKHFAILHNSKQPFDNNPCNELYCDYMCILKDRATCICSNGESIKPNNICMIDKVNSVIKKSKNTRHITNVYSVTIIILIVGVLILCVYYYYQKVKLKKSSNTFKRIHFHNPAYSRRDEVEVTLNCISDLIPGQHEYINPIDDKLLKTAIKCSAQKSDQSSEDAEKTENKNARCFARNNIIKL